MDGLTRKLGLACMIVTVLLLVCGLALFAYMVVSDARLECMFGNVMVARVALCVGSVAAIWFLVEMLRIMRLVMQGDPFCPRTVTSLWHIALCCAIAAAAVLFILFFRASFGLALCAAILLFGMLCATVLALVFRQAVRYKQENDLTI